RTLANGRSGDQMPLLELNDIHVHYGMIEAVKGISLTVGEGEIVTLIGGNGAGKTTTLKTISGLKRTSKGKIRFKDKDIGSVPAHRIVEMGIGHAPEGRRIFARMSVRENLEMGLYASGRDAGKSTDAFDRVYTLFPILQERTSQAGGTLS